MNSQTLGFAFRAAVDLTANISHNLLTRLSSLHRPDEITLATLTRAEVKRLVARHYDGTHQQFDADTLADNLGDALTDTDLPADASDDLKARMHLASQLTRDDLEFIADEVVYDLINKPDERLQTAILEALGYLASIRATTTS